MSAQFLRGIVDIEDFDLVQAHVGEFVAQAFGNEFDLQTFMLSKTPFTNLLHRICPSPSGDARTPTRAVRPARNWAI